MVNSRGASKRLQIFNLMDAALLEGESSSRWGVAGGRRAYKSRSDAIAYGSPYQKAAALVDLAEDGSGLPEEILESPNIESSAKYYFMYIRFDILWTLNYFALVALNFFEGVTLIILVVHTLFPILYEGVQLYWKSHVNKLKGLTRQPCYLIWNACHISQYFGFITSVSSVLELDSLCHL
uniref:Uncharacterized protein n=1 Tax=Lactuca sativa TaxID=4236 RepID=A0A9R1XKC2_LACSA|nr:hypothetical protein LSAT_V11C400182970 [Lactuca sativa]